jgi:HNH endonuclease
MSSRLTIHVRERAGDRCEYCHLPQVGSNIPFEIDHIVSRKYQGHTDAGNLALACWYCNVVKGHATLEEFIFGLLWIWLDKNLPLLTTELYGRMCGPVSNPIT